MAEHTDKVPISIVPFHPAHQQGVDAMLDAIVPEYPEPFFHRPVKKMEELYQLPGRFYFVALAVEEVIGTAGLIISGNYAIIKSVFLAKKYRGPELNVAGRLMDTVTGVAIKHQCHTLYLGTMEQFRRAQSFYEKQGYSSIHIDELPADFPHNALDVVFYKREIG